MEGDIVLEKFRPEDFADYYRLVSNPAVMAMITERSIPPDEARMDFSKMMQRNALDLELGQFRVLDVSSGSFVGLGKLEIEEHGSVRAELGYMLLPEYWGRGLGGRIAEALVERAKDRDDLVVLTAIIDPANAASKRILANLGFVLKERKLIEGLPGEILQLIL